MMPVACNCTDMAVTRSFKKVQLQTALEKKNDNNNNNNIIDLYCTIINIKFSAAHYNV